MQLDVETQDTEFRDVFAVSAMLGCSAANHRRPFHHAAVGYDSSFAPATMEPTAMHAVLVMQDTVVTPSGEPLRTMVQVLPFHRSVASPSNVPTARHARGEEHETP
jgi:hypothetical protein